RNSTEREFESYYCGKYVASDRRCYISQRNVTHHVLYHHRRAFSSARDINIYIHDYDRNDHYKYIYSSDVEPSPSCRERECCSRYAPIITRVILFPACRHFWRVSCSDGDDFIYTFSRS